jgi:hypothetical protein
MKVLKVLGILASLVGMAGFALFTAFGIMMGSGQGTTLEGQILYFGIAAFGLSTCGGFGAGIWLIVKSFSTMDKDKPPPAP